MSSREDTETKETVWWPDRPGEGPVPVGARVHFPSLDDRVLGFWDRHGVFQRTISEREGCSDYITYDGPPGTNGRPHIGHMMQSALKDLWPRYHTMKGCRVLRKAGWDTHGLPVELTAEVELGLKSKRDIIAYGVEKYIDYCRETVFRYKDAWTEAIRRIGRFLDTDNPYATLNTEYIQTDWWVLKQAWDKGLLYQDLKIMPHCARCGTSLSAHETAQGYADISDISLYVKFPVVGAEKTYFVAWTTTAWTLLSNVALAVNPVLLYVTVENADGVRYILAEACLDALAGMIGEYKVVDRRPGAEIEGAGYRPLWEFQEGVGGEAFRVIADDYVTAADGSGVVHLALYGEDDFRIIRQRGLPTVQNVDQDGKCVRETGVYAGRYFREEGLDADIVNDLDGRGLLLGREDIVHSYPHCYRCEEPLMYYAKSGWFLRTSSFKDKMIAANSRINWYPGHIKQGRFGNWLENNVDWSISRERYWGSPLPIWTCTDCRARVCVGSLAELAELRGEPLPADFDPHKPYIDRIELTCKECGGAMKRESEVLDSWFNAGIMPWGQWGYPAAPNSDEMLANQYPADFICEAIDQTRGWFYTLLAPATMLTGQSCFRNVICTEHISDSEGRKMSKSRGNVVDPVDLCERYGADAVRWNFYTINPWTARRFNEADLSDCLKRVIIPYWNAYSFFVTYARVDNWQPEKGTEPSDRLLDRWILSRLEWLRESIESALDGYDCASAAGAVAVFIDELTNWFIRRSRRRFWKSEDDQDKRAAYTTLHAVLCRTNRMLAPFMPFIAEVVYQNLERSFDPSAPDSVHLANWPASRSELRDTELERAMSRTREVVTLARSLRNEGGVRTRQPLPELILAGEGEELGPELEGILLDELNVKRLRRVSDPGELLSYRARADFKSLGPRLADRMKPVSEAIAVLDDAAVRRLLEEGEIQIEGETFNRDEIIVEQVPNDGFWVRSEGDLTVGLDHRVDGTLRAEWMAREFVHQVQNLRRTADLEVTQRIHIEFDGTEQIREAVARHKSYICSETLATKLTNSAAVSPGVELKIGDQAGRIDVEPSDKR